MRYQPVDEFKLLVAAREQYRMHPVDPVPSLRAEGSKMKKAWRQVIVYPGEDGYRVAECPSLPGCISQGSSRDQAIENIKEAIQEYVTALEEDHLPVPPERYEAVLVEV